MKTRADNQQLLNIGLTIVTSVMMFELVFLSCILAFINIPAENSRAFDQFVTGFWVQLAAVVGFFVGRNSSGKQAEDTIHALVTNPPPQPAPTTVMPPGSTVTTTTSVEAPPPSGDTP